LGLPGVQAVMTVDGPTAADVFRASVQQGLAPTLAPGEVVVRDHVAAPKAVGLQQAIARRRARVLDLPPYAPALAPIEPCWGTVKMVVRTAQARAREALDTAITHALAMVTAADADHWFSHGDYALQ
jgi:transposase